MRKSFPQPVDCSVNKFRRKTAKSASVAIFFRNAVEKPVDCVEKCGDFFLKSPVENSFSDL